MEGTKDIERQLALLRSMGFIDVNENNLDIRNNKKEGSLIPTTLWEREAEFVYLRRFNDDKCFGERYQVRFIKDFNNENVLMMVELPFDHKGEILEHSQFLALENEEAVYSIINDIVFKCRDGIIISGIIDGIEKLKVSLTCLIDAMVEGRITEYVFPEEVNMGVVHSILHDLYKLYVVNMIGGETEEYPRILIFEINHRRFLLQRPSEENKFLSIKIIDDNINL